MESSESEGKFSAQPPHPKRQTRGKPSFRQQKINDFTPIVIKVFETYSQAHPDEADNFTAAKAKEKVRDMDTFCWSRQGNSGKDAYSLAMDQQLMSLKEHCLNSQISVQEMANKMIYYLPLLKKFQQSSFGANNNNVDQLVKFVESINSPNAASSEISKISFFFTSIFSPIFEQIKTTATASQTLQTSPNARSDDFQENVPIKPAPAQSPPQQAAQPNIKDMIQQMVNFKQTVIEFKENNKIIGPKDAEYIAKLIHFVDTISSAHPPTIEPKRVQTYYEKLFLPIKKAISNYPSAQPRIETSPDTHVAQPQQPQPLQQPEAKQSHISTNESNDKHPDAQEMAQQMIGLLGELKSFKEEEKLSQTDSDFVVRLITYVEGLSQQNIQNIEASKVKLYFNKLFLPIYKRLQSKNAQAQRNAPPAAPMTFAHPPVEPTAPPPQASIPPAVQPAPISPRQAQPHRQVSMPQTPQTPSSSPPPTQESSAKIIKEFFSKVRTDTAVFFATPHPPHF